MRAPIQVLVIPFRKDSDGKYLFAVFHRRRNPMWQFISGGAEDAESPLQAAQREIMEEAGIPSDRPLIRLDSSACIPRIHFNGTARWPADLLVVPEYSFGVKIDGLQIRISDEHDEFQWLSYQAAHDILRWDSNRVALWELNQRLTRIIL